jgi:uncharacterized flavoprotein (TIGR03862 family)
MSLPLHQRPSVAVIGGGPAGLMAAEVLLAGGAQVDVYDAMPSVGRKFLMAGKGGLNITHAEPWQGFIARYGAARENLEPLLADFPPDTLREWIHGLGIETFVGSSGRVFPKEMKAAPLLRGWLRRLREGGAVLHMRHRWVGWDETTGALRFTTPQGDLSVIADAVVLAMGGGSWPQLGSDGAWREPLVARGVPLTPFAPSNCGFDRPWSNFFQERFAGMPVKPVVVRFRDAEGREIRRQGEFVITAGGVEGGLIYAFSAGLRDEIAQRGTATLFLDLAHKKTLEQLQQDLARGRGKNSLANYLRKAAGLEGVKAGLLREILPPKGFEDPARLAAAIKAYPLTLTAPRPLEEAISTAGGVAFAGLTDGLMLKPAPGVFCAGEMLDWDAPTGGYLLTACLASGRAAGKGALRWLEARAG